MANRPTYEELKRKVAELENRAVEHERAEQRRLEREKLQGVLEMAGAVCHELNQPLQVLLGYCGLLLRDMSQDNPLYGYVDEIRGRVSRMGEITGKLMGITAYETKEYLEGTKIIDIDKASSISNKKLYV
jgi:signal transduction histidine kinase